MIFYHLIGLIISLSVLIWGADKFIDNSSLIAKKLGLSELTIGLTIVALGTSAPEIFVGISSVLNGTESIAMGAVVGSNISNIALIFGVSCIGISMTPTKTNPIQFIPFVCPSPPSLHLSTHFHCYHFDSGFRPQCVTYPFTTSSYLRVRCFTVDIIDTFFVSNAVVVNRS